MLEKKGVIVLSKPADLRIIQVGCGGTGGYLVPLISKFLRSVGFDDASAKESYFLVDGDVVEEKNMLRQNFLPGDVGKKKADVLADRYGATSIPRFFDASMDFVLQSLFFVGGTNIIIGCVDRITARLQIWDALNRFKTFPIWYIDVGNERTHGQVVVARNVSETNPYDLYGDRNILEPAPIDIREYFGSVDEKGVDEEHKHISCAEMGGQSIFMNNMAAAHVFGVVTELVTTDVASVSEIQFSRYRMTNNVTSLALLLQSI